MKQSLAAGKSTGPVTAQQIILFVIAGKLIKAKLADRKTNCYCMRQNQKQFNYELNYFKEV